MFKHITATCNYSGLSEVHSLSSTSVNHMGGMHQCPSCVCLLTNSKSVVDFDQLRRLMNDIICLLLKKKKG